MSTLPASINLSLDILRQKKLIGIVRTDSAERAIWTSALLIATGLHIIEIPYTVPEASRVIETLSQRFPKAGIGAGTILEQSQADSAIQAGARFLVSPVLDEAIIRYAHSQDILMLPGCMTPTEMMTAWRAGAPAIKFFPAEPSGGPEFISAVRGPLPQGGIQLSNVSGYLKAGALAVGVGNPLIPRQWVASRNESKLRALAQQYLQAVEATGP